MAIIGPFDFSQGLNTRAGVQVTPKFQASTLQGFYPDYLSIKNQNNFYSITGATPLTVNARPTSGLTYWEDPAATNAASKIIVAVNDSKIWRIQYQESGLSGTFTDCTGTATVSNGSNINYQFASLNSILVGVGNSLNANPPFKLTSSSGNCANLGGSPPKGECVITVNNFMFIGGDLTNSSTKSKVFWSNVSDPETWGAGNFVSIGLGDGDQVVAFSSIGTDLYIFKQRSIWRLSTVTTSTSGTVTLGPLSKFSSMIGTYGKFSVDNLPDGTIVFLGTDNHLYRLDGSSMSQISDFPPPGPSVQPSIIISSINGTIVWQNHVKVYPQRNWVLVQTTSNVIYAFDYIRNLWLQLVNDGNAVYTIQIAPPTRPDTFTNNSFSAIIGTGNGLIEILDDNYTSSGTPTDNVCVVNVPLPIDRNEFQPRSIILSMDTGGYINVRFGWDGTYNSSDALSITNATRTKYVIPIPTKDSTSGIPFRVLNVKLTCPATRTATVYPVYVSDEVLS